MSFKNKMQLGCGMVCILFLMFLKTHSAQFHTNKITEAIFATLTLLYQLCCTPCLVSFGRVVAEGFPQGVKWPEHLAVHCPPPPAKAKNVWSSTLLNSKSPTVTTAAWGV